MMDDGRASRRTANLHIEHDSLIALTSTAAANGEE